MSMKTTFTSTCAYEGQPESKVVLETNAEDLNQLLAEFENFLRGSSFVINGRINIVDGDESGDTAFTAEKNDEIKHLTKLANERLATIEAMEAEVNLANEDARKFGEAKQLLSEVFVALYSSDEGFRLETYRKVQAFLFGGNK